jgi:hypothetical protein
MIEGVGVDRPRPLTKPETRIKGSFFFDATVAVAVTVAVTVKITCC